MAEHPPKKVSLGRQEVSALIEILEGIIGVVRVLVVAAQKVVEALLSFIEEALAHPAVLKFLFPGAFDPKVVEVGADLVEEDLWGCLEGVQDAQVEGDE